MPYVGALFRSTGTTHERLVRLILITPRMKRASGGDVAPDLTSQLARASTVAPAAAMAVPSQIGAALLPAGQATQAKPSGQSMQPAPSALER